LILLILNTGGSSMRHNRILVILVLMLLTMVVFIPSYQAPNTNNPIENRDDCIVLINESFENGFPPDNWTNTGWMDSYYGEPYDGDHWAFSWTFGDVLTTSPLEFGVNTTLTFWYRAESQYHPMSSEVYVNDTLVWGDYDYTHDDYVMATVHLDSFSGLKTIAFHGHLNGDFYGDLLDMITVTTLYSIVYVDDDFNSSTPGWQYDHFDVIQDGIDAVAENGTVYVYNGTYFEHVIVNKSIDLLGESRNSTIIDGGGMNNVFNISADFVTISGFDLENSNYGFYLNNSNNCLIDNCNCNNSEEGVYFTQSCYNFISNISYNNTTIIIRISEYSNNNYIENCTSPPASNSFIGIINSNNNIISTSTCKGIEIAESQNNTITRCYYTYTWIGESINNYVINNVVPNSIIDLGSGAYYNNIINNTCYEICLMFDASNNVINNNRVSNGSYGISLGGGPPSDVRPSYNHITNNTITNCTKGIAILNQCNFNQVENNTITFGDYGIHLISSKYNQLSNNTLDANNDSGIRIEYSNNNTINNNVIINNTNYGIQLYRSNGNIVDENTVLKNLIGVLLHYADLNNIENNLASNNSEVGIHILRSSNNTIQNNNITENQNTGIKLVRSINNNVIKNNTVNDNNYYGIYLYNSTNNLLNCNNVSHHNLGIYIYFTSNMNTISNNVLSMNNDSIRVFGSHNNTIIENKVLSSLYDGIKITNLANNNIISDNLIADNGMTGVLINHFSMNNLVYHNNFISNNPNAFDDNIYNNSWDNGYPSGGNYWDDYTGIDTNDDGIGETPYNISAGNNQDNYPFTQPNGWLIEIDINQSTHNRGFPIRHATDGDWAGAQNFIPTQNNLAFSKIYLRKFGTPEFNLTVELREDSIDGPILDTLVFTPSEVPSTWTWLELDFTDIIVTPETDYFIVCPPAPSGVTTSFGYEWGYAFGNQYDDGAFWFTRDSGNLWRDLPTMYEFVFRTYGYN